MKKIIILALLTSLLIPLLAIPSYADYPRGRLVIEKPSEGDPFIDVESFIEPNIDSTTNVLYKNSSCLGMVNTTEPSIDANVFDHLINLLIRNFDKSIIVIY